MARPVARVQLRSRHWRIRTIKGELVDEVVGDGVVGVHPVLEAGAHLQMILSSRCGRRPGRPPCAGSRCAHPVLPPVRTSPECNCMSVHLAGLYGHQAMHEMLWLLPRG